MASADLGARDAHGEWKPTERIEFPPPFQWPIKPLAILKWLFGFPGYLWPLNAFWVGTAALTWFLLTPPLESMATFRPGWMAWIVVRNAALLFVWFGLWHLRLYVQRAQGMRYKYSNRWLSTKHRGFTFNNQTRDNLFWTVVSGGSVWSAYEILTLWAYANNYLPFVELRTNPVYFVALMVLIPLIRDIHFYWIHRLLHWKPLYKAAHYLHHRNINVGPWSGLSMHPVEHLLYFTGVFLHWILPSHPLHAIFHLQHAALSPATGHTGYEKAELGNESLAMKHGSYYHYLHHRYFECNYAGDNGMMFDRMFGSFHDGTDEGHARMRARTHARMRKRRA